MSVGRPKGSLKFSTEEAKERNRERNRLAYQQKKNLSNEFVDLRKFNRGKIWLTDEEKKNRKRISNLNNRNKKRLEKGLPLLTLDDIKCYKQKRKKHIIIEFEIIDENIIVIS